MINPKAIVICGDGINCDQETSWALQLAGFDVSIRHVTALLEKPQSLMESRLLCIPGGFSFGDEIASGKVLAVKIDHYMKELLQQFVDSGNLVMGICNGFQVLVQMGLLPVSQTGEPRTVSLSRNAQGKFINRWFEMQVEKKNKASEVFFAGLDKIELPIRHGEGNLKVGSDRGAIAESESLVRRHIALRYAESVNGSFERIAGLCNEDGTVMGLMPHPEAFVRWTQHPQWTNRHWREKRVGSSPDNSRSTGGSQMQAHPDGMRIFQNAYKYAISGAMEKTNANSSD
jgi:phosphoribosylformylglycinamidine synthase